jgi:hypothetical protein
MLKVILTCIEKYHLENHYPSMPCEWNHGKVYIKSCQKNNKLKKRQFFMQSQESRFKFNLNFILKLLSLQLGLL